MFGDESMFCTEVFWCGTDHLPEIDPAGLPFLVPPPNPRRTGNRNGKRSASLKNNAYFVFNLLIINNIN